MNTKDAPGRALFKAAIIVVVLAGVNAAYFAAIRPRIAPAKRFDEPPPENSIAAALLAANERYPFRDGVVRKGYSTIHELDYETARSIEEALRLAANRTKLPVNFLAAHVLRESTGDPQAEFRNPAGWDQAGDDRERFAAADHGLVQISGRNLLAMFPNEPLDALKARAEDVRFAVDFLADAVQENLDWAKQIQAEKRPGVDPRVLEKARNPYWLAALAYNRGRGGALSALGNRRACRHADLVVSAWGSIDARTRPGSVPAPVFPPEPPDDPRLLAVGDAGGRVEALQRLLNDRLSPSPDLKPDGNFGPATRRALERFQTQSGLTSTGEADLETWEELLGLKYATNPDAAAPLTLGDRGKRVERLQGLLNARLSPRPSLMADGNFGPATRDALIRFQQSRSLPAVGAADAATWGALNSNPDAR